MSATDAPIKEDRMRIVLSAVLIAAIGGCSSDGQVTPTQPRADVVPPPAGALYRIDRLATPSGNSQGGGINEHGWVAGYTGGSDGTRHAAFWRNQTPLDLGTLGGIDGLHSSAQWPGVNNSGVVVGISQTAALDTLGESWSCASFIPANGHVCLGFVWDGVMRALPTLGGENGFAAGVNDRGDVVGWAETPVHDSTCHTPQVLQFRAVRWEARTLAAHQLRPFPGDSASAATAINDQGQVVGISGKCDVAVGRRSATRAVLWDGDRIVDLGNLGGDFWQTPMAINNHGDVVGFSNPPGGDLDGDSLRAFLWTQGGGMKDLGRLEGDGLSEALGINMHGQIVGVSCGDVCHAVLWQDGKMLKLQDLVGSAFPDLLWSARDISDSGKITGRLIDHVTGKTVAYVATPIAP
jgi:probable HAF family extracellular repeat protein